MRIIMTESDLLHYCTAALADSCGGPVLHGALHEVTHDLYLFFVLLACFHLQNCHFIPSYIVMTLSLPTPFYTLPTSLLCCYGGIGYCM